MARRGSRLSEAKEAVRKRKAAIHDRLFRVTFGQVERAKALLRHALPKELVDSMDWSTLRREMNALAVEEDETRKDLVYSVRRVGSGPEEPPHFFVLEHQLKSVMEPTQAEVLMRTMEEVLKRQGRREGRKEGLAEGLAKAVLECLSAREIEVDEASRKRIESCQDPEVLERWLRRAARANRLSEVLEEPGA